jgi:hypothetical protein
MCSKISFKTSDSSLLYEVLKSYVPKCEQYLSLGHGIGHPNIHVHIYVYTYVYTCTYICVYIYIYKERASYVHNMYTHIVSFPNWLSVIILSYSNKSMYCLKLYIFNKNQIYEQKRTPHYYIDKSSEET